MVLRASVQFLPCQTKTARLTNRVRAAGRMTFRFGRFLARLADDGRHGGLTLCQGHRFSETSRKAGYREMSWFCELFDAGTVPFQPAFQCADDLQKSDQILTYSYL